MGAKTLNQWFFLAGIAVFASSCAFDNASKGTTTGDPISKLEDTNTDLYVTALGEGIEAKLCVDRFIAVLPNGDDSIVSLLQPQFLEIKEKEGAWLRSVPVLQLLLERAGKAFGVNEVFLGLSSSCPHFSRSIEVTQTQEVNVIQTQDSVLMGFERLVRAEESQAEPSGYTLSTQSFLKPFLLSKSAKDIERVLLDVRGSFYPFDSNSGVSGSFDFP